MSVILPISQVGRPPRARDALALLKPITWFPPIWAYLCGAVSAGAPAPGALWLLPVGLVLAGPVVCGMSQAANDWCDREVDAINEPDRPIPSGRVPAPWALAIALAMSVLALALGATLGRWGFGATVCAVAAAWAYSLPPMRLKRSWLWGPALVGLCYEGLPWITGAAVLAGGAPAPAVLVVALLYAAGAWGIMTLNDFKALEGDRQTGVNSLPVRLGPARAARVACWAMALAQLAVIAGLVGLDRPWQALAIAGLLVAQVAAMRRLLADPRGRAPWYSAVGVTLYVAGMMVAATALRDIGGA